MPTQVENGKAFEYAIATSYYQYLKDELHLSVELVRDSAFEYTERCYNSLTEHAQQGFRQAALKTIETMLVIEPGLAAEKNASDTLKIHIAPDVEGQFGDVRDVIFQRLATRPIWEIGFSAKNNHDAVKHSRLSLSIDFGKEWLANGEKDTIYHCSPAYFDEIKPIFSWIRQLRSDNPEMKWSDLGDAKSEKVYKPLLDAFLSEMLRLNESCPDVPKRLLNYLIGKMPFYKIIKDDRNNLVIVKAFNLGGKLNRTVNGMRPKARTEHIRFPKRIIEFAYKENSDNTLLMVLDEGWQISFRIHSASTFLENSLKFDIQLIGNPPVLFTQHLFNL